MTDRLSDTLSIFHLMSMSRRSVSCDIPCGAELAKRGVSQVNKRRTACMMGDERVLSVFIGKDVGIFARKGRMELKNRNRMCKKCLTASMRAAQNLTSRLN